MEEEKTVYESKAICPTCKEHLIVRVKDKIVEPAVKAEKIRRIIVEKDTQTTLKQVGKKS